MKFLFLYGFILGCTLASPVIRPQDPEKHQNIMDINVGTKCMKSFGNCHTQPSQVKSRQKQSQQQDTGKVVDVQVETKETLLNKSKVNASEMSSNNFKILKYFHKRSASTEQYLNEPNEATISIHPDNSLKDEVNIDQDDTSENDNSDNDSSVNDNSDNDNSDNDNSDNDNSDNDNSENAHDSNNTGSSEDTNSAGSSESSNPTVSTSMDNLSSSEEITYDYQETGSEEVNRSSLNAVTVQTDSSESATQISIFTTPDNDSSNESGGSSEQANGELSNESASSSSSSESNEHNDSSKCSTSSDSNTSSDSSEPISVTATDKIF